MNIKYRLKLLFLLLNITFINNSLSNPVTYNYNNYDIYLSADNNLKFSQNNATDLAFSAISLMAYISDSNNLSDNLLYRVPLAYGAFTVALLNHEIAGHGFRGMELGGKIQSITINFFGGKAKINNITNPHLQKDILISLGGNEVNYLLSQKIANNLVKNNRLLDPITSAGYIFSAGNQLFLHLFVYC